MKNLRLLVCLLMLMPLRPNDAPGQRPSAAGDGDAGSLRGGWTLIRLVDGGVERPLGEAQITLCFAPDGAVTGQTGVNLYQGRYTADPDGGLHWLASFSLTGLAGPDPIMRLELVYMPALYNASRWRIVPAGPELHLATPDGRTTLTFRKQPASRPAPP